MFRNTLVFPTAQAETLASKRRSMAPFGRARTAAAMLTRNSRDNIN
jgi:hypothetical protein